MAKVLKIAGAVAAVCDVIGSIKVFLNPDLLTMTWLIVLLIAFAVFASGVAVYWSWELWVQTPRVKREIEFWNALADGNGQKLAHLIARKGTDEAQRRDLRDGFLRAWGSMREADMAEKAELAWLANRALEWGKGQSNTPIDAEKWGEAMKRYGLPDRFGP